MIIFLLLVLYKYSENERKTRGTIKQLYFLSSQDVLNSFYSHSFNCEVNQLLLWKSYLTYTNHISKNILLMFSNSAAVTDNTFKIFKVFGKF